MLKTDEKPIMLETWSLGATAASAPELRATNAGQCKEGATREATRLRNQPLLRREETKNECVAKQYAFGCLDENEKTKLTTVNRAKRPPQSVRISQ